MGQFAAPTLGMLLTVVSDLYQDSAVVTGTPFRYFIERLRPNFFVEPPRSKHVVKLGVGSGRECWTACGSRLARPGSPRSSARVWD